MLKAKLGRCARQGRTDATGKAGLMREARQDRCASEGRAVA
jgi:hypothetical protein